MKKDLNKNKSAVVFIILADVSQSLRY